MLRKIVCWGNEKCKFDIFIRYEWWISKNWNNRENRVEEVWSFLENVWDN